MGTGLRSTTGAGAWTAGMGRGATDGVASSGASSAGPSSAVNMLRNQSGASGG